MKSNDPFIKKIDSQLKKISFSVLGAIDEESKIHTFGTDSKIIGRVFEMFTQPVIEKVAEELGYDVNTPTSQNTYPDFILIPKSEANQDNSLKKIAIDVKTTYRKNDKSQIRLTLGSYCSYMRNNTKNIEGRYTDYIKHYVIGFVYRRNDKAQESRVFEYNNRGQIIPPYNDVQYFVQEKYKIAGDKPGSGNTENIGTFPTTDINLLKAGKGPFATLGSDVFDLYWKYYPRYRDQTKNYQTLPEFKIWLSQQDNLKALRGTVNIQKICADLSNYFS